MNEATGEAWLRCMKSGDFESAWRAGDEIERREPARVWQGEWFAGKRVLIRCLHGFGDTIQFIRYARELKRVGALSVVAQMHPELVELISTAPGLDRAVPWGPVPDFDVEIEMMELPWAFRTTVATIPAHIPYLFPERRTSRASGVCLIWSSSEWDPSRSVPLREIAPALFTCGITPWSLQHGPPHVEAIGCRAIRYCGEQSSDMMDTAADLMAADLLITVDTMAAHMAGALGRPVWVLLKHDADWRWMEGRPDSPWYPTMRLFRQRREGDWAGVIERTAEALRSFTTCDRR